MANGVCSDRGQSCSANNTSRCLRRHVTTWDFTAKKEDELSLTRGDILLVVEEFDDAWVRGIRLRDLEIGFFPKNFIAEDTPPIYKLGDIKFSTEYYVNDPKFIDYDSSKRSKVALEICMSEQSYLRKLKLLEEKFASPLSQNGLISTEEHGAMFRHLQVLINLSQCLLVYLQSRMEGWDEKKTLMGDIFLDLGHHMKVFTSYAIQHTLGSQLIIKLGSQDKFKAWLEKAEVECRRTLNSLLMEPIQRIPRYELLLKDLIKHTTEEHPDRVLLTDALEFVQRIAHDCNDSVHRANNELKLYSITKRFPNDDVNVVLSKKMTMNRERENRRKKFTSLRLKNGSSRNLFMDASLSFRNFFEVEHQRSFVREGPVMKTKSNFTDPSERYLFLCSDVLIIAQPNSRSRKSFRLKERVLLRHVWVTDTLTMNDGKIPERGFIVGTPIKTYHFLASSAEEKKSWFSQLQECMLDQKRLFYKLLSHLSIPDEKFFYTRAKVKVHHLGMGNDELSFRAGDEISVIGFKDEQERWRAGLYSQEEPFDPSPEWYFGLKKGQHSSFSFGWFPAQCLFGADADARPLEPSPEELEPTAMCIILSLKQRMKELTGREVPPLTEPERVVKVYLAEGNFKTLRISSHGSVNDIVRKYFRVRPDRNLQWSLFEQSQDNTVQRLVEAEEDPSQVVDFWGKSRDQMRFFLKQSLVHSAPSLEA